MNRMLLLPLLALIAATMACSLTAAPPVEVIDPPDTLDFDESPFTFDDFGDPADDTNSFVDDFEPDASDEVDNSDDNDDAPTNVGSSNSGGATNGGGGFVPPPCVPRADWTLTYTIVSGDTLNQIASRADTNGSTLATGNCLANPNLLEVGQVLRVPRQVRPREFVRIDRPPEVIGGVANIYLDDRDRFTITGSANGPQFERRLRVNVTDAGGNGLDFKIEHLQAGDGGQWRWQAALSAPAMGGNGGIVRVELIDDRDRTLADDVMQVNFIGGRTEPADVTIFTQASHVQLLTDGSGRQVVRIEGSMDGVPDNRVDIEILDTTGTVFLGTQTVYLPNIVPPGQYGEWGVNVHVPDALPGMNGQLRVFSRVGGALVASDGYDFMFREGPNTVTLRIDEPTELQAIPVNADVAEFRAAGVASNTSFVRLRLVSQGQILTETSAPVDANGRWNAILRVTVEPGTQAQLQATFGNARDFTAISFS